MKCGLCNKKLNLSEATIGKCKCNSEKTFCIKHRFPLDHNCTYDFKKSAREELMKNNPVVKADKMVRI